MFKVKIHLVGGSSLEYSSNDEDEPNKIRHSLGSNILLSVPDGKRELWINPQNVLLVDITEVDK
ncbi:MULTISPECIES: hypothetical protein [unclassified Streptococcus]|uniref:hypothetical protein n=1 Tax=unclassified Streptococcus TaxID=2608887 RepID=UPI00211B34EB|nr:MULTISPECIES: hypothetical protein [unclassified Streptococcus]MCQ9211641.1 hypothetical protein [Streptococcus sp. B01]MCQ9213158.1 hypothetical protein [Streptococcus sp. O1]MCQ9214946.1 hypothetical protein [Streptococcus sp. O1]MCQ9215080.1 hypothetical protein [Streptococcus sp. O1]